ncbi:MAG TPA: RDD family protein [Nitrospiria bacterium]|nr:RDD family protein [Nitrospiria bacterium]
MYPSLPLRWKVAMIDGVILLTVTMLLPLATNQINGGYSFLNIVALLGPVMLLEPFLISFRGATIGQSWFGMSVLYIKTRGRCPLPNSYLRYVTKMLLGGVSLVYMYFSHRHQAIHDHLAGTVVVFTDALAQYRATSGSLELPEREEDVQFIYPSIFRRFMVFLGWYVVAFALFIIVLSLTLLIFDPACLRVHSKGDALCAAIGIAGEFLLLILFLQIAYMGAKGRLPGAKRHREDL